MTENWSALSPELALLIGAGVASAAWSPRIP
jgi:hypothetical protein